MIKKLTLIVLLSCGIQICADARNPQRILYDALQCKDTRSILDACTMYEAYPIFTISVDGTRTIKQVNALNYAIRLYKQSGQEGQKLLIAMLSHLTPEDFNTVLTYMDQEEQKTPEDVFNELFLGQDINEFLGRFIKRHCGGTLFEVGDHSEWYNEI